MTLLSANQIAYIFRANDTEAATDGFQNNCSLFPGATFLQFSSICSSNRHVFSRKVYYVLPRKAYMFFEQTRIFQEGLSNRHVFQGGSICSLNRPYYLIEQIMIFPERSSNIYEFFRSFYFLIEHIQIFQEPLFSYQTDIHFPGSPNLVIEHILFSRRPLCLEHIGIFQEGTPVEQIFR